MGEQFWLLASEIAVVNACGWGKDLGAPEWWRSSRCLRVSEQFQMHAKERAVRIARAGEVVALDAC